MKASTTSNNMRGQIGLRSGPLAPTSAKLTTQYLVLDHMNNHYTKITKAKSAIDNRPPKTMTTSQKARDRKTRDHVTKTGVRPSSALKTRRPHTTTGYYQDDYYDENLWGEVDPEDEEEMLIHNIMRTTLRQNEDPGTNTAYHADPNNNNQGNHALRQRPSSARSHRSAASGISRTMVQTQTKKGTYDGDLLEKRSQVFTEQKPFTPRTLKTDRKSRLSQSKSYNKVPPKAKKVPNETPQQQLQSEKPPRLQLGETNDTMRKQTMGSTADMPPQPKPRARQRLDRTREGPVTMDSMMFETLHSRDFSQFNKDDNKDENIPKLDISMDTDHLKWIKEQATKAHMRAGNDTLKSTLREEDAADTTVDFGKTGEMSLTFGTLGSTKTRPPLGGNTRVNIEDTEAQYVKFMNDITNEVINRGIYTDRALRQVFKAHIAKNKGRLDEHRMNEITDEIRKELDIPRYDIDDDTSYTMTKESNHTYNGYDDHSQHPNDRVARLRGQGHDLENGMNGSSTMETSLKSKASKCSTDDPSHDSYNFKSTEDEELFSTIRSDMNNTANMTGTLNLQNYQATIKEQEAEELEEGEVIVREDDQDDVHASRRHNGHVTNDRNGVRGEDKREVTPVKHDNNETEEEDEAYEDDYDDDIYEDDGDDEDEVQQTTEATATYRTDDDDF